MYNIGAGAILAALYDDELAEEVDPPEVYEVDFDDLGEEVYYEWHPICVDDCEMCGCHGECDPSDPWRWAINHDDEIYEEADSVPYDYEVEDS